MGSNVAVIQYADDGTGTLLDPIPSALVAPEATNLLTYSSGNGTIVVPGWTWGGTDTSEAVAILPNEIQGYNLSGTGYRYINRGISPLPDTTYTASVYVDPGSTYVGVCIQLRSFDDIVGDLTASAADTDADGRVILTFTTGTDVAGSIRFGKTASSADSLTWGAWQLEEGATASPFIATQGATATRDKDEIILDNLNLNATEGSLYFELIAGQDTANLLDGFLSMTSGVVEADDGTNQASSAEVVAVGVESKVALVWSAAGMEQCADGVWSPLEPYAGSLNDGVLDLFRDATASNQMRELQIWDTAEKAIIDALMAG